MKIVFIVTIFSGMSRSCFANNLSVSDVSLTDHDSVDNTVRVQFDVSWDNSWHNSENYDAVWVFMKYSTDSGTTWYPAFLKTAGSNPSDASEGTGTDLDILVPTDFLGAFLQRAEEGTGTVSNTDVELTWNYGASTTDAVSAMVRVFAIEMVYIPAGAFYIGDGNGSSESTYALHTTDNTAILLSDTAVTLTTDSNANDDIDTASNAISCDANLGSHLSWPVGCYAYYLMKYEITEGQWVAFFNTLTSAQKTNRDITSSTGKNSDAVVNRNTIAWSSGDATTTRADRAMSYLSWMDLAAYLDWAGLRPMSETEFEKAARGPSYAVYSEYVTGSTTDPGTIATITLVGSSTTEDGTEVSGTASAGVNAQSTSISGGGETASMGPVRVGIFATGSASREQSGAGYYGNMELMGNVMERVVTLANSAGRQFAASHGNGYVSSSAPYEGASRNSDWPGWVGSTAVIFAHGAGGKGAGYVDDAGGPGFKQYLKISDRQEASKIDATRSNDFGGRGARTAPTQPDPPSPPPF